MNLIRKLFWLAMFVVATFLWIVLFEHGVSGFSEGVRLEFEKIKTLAAQKPKPPDDNSDTTIP